MTLHTWGLGVAGKKVARDLCPARRLRVERLMRLLMDGKVELQ